MAGNYEDILKIEIDNSDVTSTTEKINDMEKKIAEASKKSTQGFIEFEKTVDKNNKSLGQTTVWLDKIFNKIKLSKLSGGFAGLGETTSTVGKEIAGMAGMGGLISGGLVAAIAALLTKAFDIAEKSVGSTTKAARYGTSAREAAALEFAAEYVGMSKSALTSSAFGLNTKLKDVNSGAALSILGMGLDREKLSKMDTTQALLTILTAVKNNPMSKDQNLQKLLLGASSSLGINEEAMLDAMQSPERFNELISAIQLGEKEYGKVDYAAQRKAGQATIRTKAGAGIAGGQMVGGIGKFQEGVATLLIKLAPGLQGDMDKSSTLVNTVIRQSN